MSIQRSPRVDRDTAEHLLAGNGVGPVASVLRAAAAPPHPQELVGEEAAVAAFRAAATATPRRTSVFRSVLAKVLTVKAVIVVAIAGSTGIVLAASEGALPVPWSNSPADPPATTTTTTPPAQNTPGSRTTDHRRPPAAPDPSIVGLCEAYTAHEDKNLDNPAFRALVDAAGGKGEVEGYCETVEATAPGKPSATGEPEVPGEDQRPETPPARTPSETERPGPGERPEDTEPPTEPNKPGKPSKNTRTTETEPTNTETPDSYAPGAATAVPPSGAEPPSVGS